MKRKLLMLRLMLCRNGFKRAEYLKKIRYFHHQGEHCCLIPSNYGTEPYLISLGNNVFVASGVTFITHDITSKIFSYMDPPNNADLVKRVGKIEIGDHVFIGAKSTILYDVKIGNRVIVAAGTLVNRDLPDGGIYAGVPAKRIGDFDSYLVKNREFSRNAIWDDTQDPRDIRKKQIEFFWKED